MIGYVITALAAGLFADSRAKARARKRERALARKPSWQLRVAYISQQGYAEQIRVSNEPRGYQLERSVLSGTSLEVPDRPASAGDVVAVMDVRKATGIENVIELVADIVSENVGDPVPVRLDLWRYDVDGYARRAALASVNEQPDRVIGQVEILYDGGRGLTTRNYSGPNVAELVHLFITSQLGITWEEGMFR